MHNKNPLTPGVYIQETSVFAGEAVSAPTAVPVFIGYTRKADHAGEDLSMKAVSISSMEEYIYFFGQGADVKLAVKTWPPVTLVNEGMLVLPPVPVDFSVERNDQLHSFYFDYRDKSNYYLYKSMLLFYQNGGGNCFIVSVGTYPSVPCYQDLKDGLALVDDESEISLISIPDSLLLPVEEHVKLNLDILEVCESSQRTFALFDVYGGENFKDADYLISNQGTNIIEYFRNNLGGNSLQHGAAYFPWLETSLFTLTEIRPEAIDLSGFIASGIHEPESYLSMIREAAVRFINIMPVSPAIAGVYTSVDTSRGVWKAPANVSLNAVVKPLYDFKSEQGLGIILSVDPDAGKSINLIRIFEGVGTMVWGARTLDGNSHDWKYINVRRTMTMIEQSVKLAAQPYVFEPNEADTWVSIESMISVFLNSLWKQGALAGAVVSDAFSVNVGLGKTMTGDDILNGIMKIVVLVAPSNPADFLVFSFEQQMLKS